MNFIDRLEKLLEERNEKRADFCRNTGIKESTIRGWKIGQTPNVETALKIADYFGVSVKWLFTGKGEVLPEDERKILDDYRTMDSVRKKAVRTVCDALRIEKKSVQNSVQNRD